MTTAKNLNDAIARAKDEIRDDIKHGHIDGQVSEFADLHDYVDANMYGGLNDLAFEDLFWEANGGLKFDVANDLQSALDAWIKAGMPAD